MVEENKQKISLTVLLVFLSIIIIALAAMILINIKPGQIVHDTTQSIFDTAEYIYETNAAEYDNVVAFDESIKFIDEQISQIEDSNLYNAAQVSKTHFCVKYGYPELAIEAAANVDESLIGDGNKSNYYNDLSNAYMEMGEEDIAQEYKVKSIRSMTDEMLQEGAGG